MNKEKIIKLINIIETNKNLMRVFDALNEIGLENYYIGAGAIAQSVWNILSDYPVEYGIDDIDIVYFDDKNITENYEAKIKIELENIIGEFPLWLDVKNQARVHIWYSQKFGYEIKPYKSLEYAIDTWPTTSTSLGLRKGCDSNWSIYAPFGIDDIFDMRIKANPVQITEEIYNKKVNKWTSKWPKLSCEKWTGINEQKRYFEVIHISPK